MSSLAPHFGDGAPARRGLPARTGKPALAVRGLRKSYGSAVAVDGISLDVDEGETLGLLGPNGAGKTTLMHLLAGALRADSGELVIAGVSNPYGADARRSIGLAPQAIALYLELTAEENLRFFGRIYGLSGALLRERVERALLVAELVDRRAHRVSTMSGGMQRRLNLAVATVHAPRILLCDEPTVGVDPQSRVHLLRTMADLASSGRTIVLSTHYIEEAERLCDRVAIVDRGRVVAVDTVARLVSAHGRGEGLEAAFLALTGRTLRE
jgi:ABC-2 type transport system ATP-binding protein